MTKEQHNLLKEAFLHVYTEEYDSYAATSSDIVFSKEFEKKSQKLINHLDSCWTYMSKRSKRFLTVLIAAILLFTSTMSVTAFRKSILDFVTNVYEAFTEIFFEEKQNMDDENYNGIETQYHLTYVPPKFREDSFLSTPDMIYQEFMSTNGKYLTFQQSPITLKTISDTELISFKEITLLNKNIYVSRDETGEMFVWNDNLYFYVLNINSKLPIDEIQKIISGIEVVK